MDAIRNDKALRTQVSRALDMPGSFGELTAYMKRLERDRAELIEALRETVKAIRLEFNAMGDDWKEQPIMRAKDKTLKRADALLSRLEKDRT